MQSYVTEQRCEARVVLCMADAPNSTGSAMLLEVATMKDRSLQVTTAEASMMTGRTHKSVISHGKYTGRYKEKSWSKFCVFLYTCTSGWHCQMALPLSQTARCMCMAQQESYIPDWQHQVLKQEACLISLSKSILICPLGFT